ncbi:tigger transposable element-derived protein 1 [Trichonephila clavipes]|nr:tigger transposable element-derived protein 1 [Trichonephila clavipes]
MCDNIKKQKRSAISLETKIKILDCLAKGERSTAVGEVASADEEAARKYPEKLAKIIKDGEYCAHQVFNADETGLFWKKKKCQPVLTLQSPKKKTASGFKAAKDRVTLLLCSNASGDRMLKPLLVNRSLKPRALKGKDLNTLPVHWMANKKAWEIGGEGFDDFGEHDIEELLVDEALNDDDILESMVDITKDLETVDSEPEEDVTPLDEKLLREGLQLSVPEEALPCRSDDVILSSSDESDLAPIHKRPDGHGYELVSSVRALVPQKFSVEEKLMHVKHVEVKSPHVGVMWKFGRGIISSGIVLVT